MNTDQHLIVVIPIGKADRTEMERIEGTTFQESELASHPIISKGKWYDLCEFTTLCNDEDLNLDDNWVCWIEVI